jgi:hypothetical protein
MRGIFSSSPSQSAIRILIGTHLLLLVQSGLVLWSDTDIDVMLRAIVAGSAILGLTAFFAAVHGGSGEERRVWTPARRHHTIVMMGDRP